MTTCSTAQANEGMMRHIGKYSQTYGHFKHWFTASLMDIILVPNIWLIGKGMSENAEKIFYKLEAREAARNAVKDENNNDDQFKK